MRKGLDPLSPEAVSAYFAELLWSRSGNGWVALDAAKVGESGLQGILRATEEGGYGLNFPFADISAAFRLIEETMVPVIIPQSISAVGGVNDGELQRLCDFASAGAVAREVQRYIVQIPRRAREALIKAGSAHALKPKKFGEQFVLLDNKSLYRDESGFNWDDPTYRDLLLM